MIIKFTGKVPRVARPALGGSTSLTDYKTVPFSEVARAPAYMLFYEREMEEK